MALRRLAAGTLSLSAAAVFGVMPPAVAAQDRPSIMHGLGQVVGGVIFELPKTVIEASQAAPVVGTIVGLVAGAARAVQTTVSGLAEIAVAFDPWRTKRR